MADCASLLDEELSSFVFNYLTENSGSQYGEEEVCSDRLDADFPDIDLSQLDASDFDSVNCLSELHWCNDQPSDASPASTLHYSTADELFEIEEENAALLAALTDSLDGMVDAEVGGLSVFPTLGEEPDQEDEDDDDLPLDAGDFSQSLGSESEDPSLLKKLLLTPPNMPAGIDTHKDGSHGHRHSNRSFHLRPVRPLIKTDTAQERKPRAVRPAGRLCTELHRHLTTKDARAPDTEDEDEEEDSESEEDEEEEDEAEEEEGEESSASEAESPAATAAAVALPPAEPPQPQFSSEKELRSVVELIRYMHTYCLPTRKQQQQQQGWERREQLPASARNRARLEASRAASQNSHHHTSKVVLVGGAGMREGSAGTGGSAGGVGVAPRRLPFARKREVKANSLLRELLEQSGSVDVSKPYRLHSVPYSHSHSPHRGASTHHPAAPSATPANRLAKAELCKDSSSSVSSSPPSSSPDRRTLFSEAAQSREESPEEGGSFSVRRSRRLASFPSRFAKRLRPARPWGEEERDEKEKGKEKREGEEEGSKLLTAHAEGGRTMEILAEPAKPCCHEKRACLCLPLNSKTTGESQYGTKPFEPTLSVDLCGTAGLTPPTTPPHKPAEDELFKPAEGGKGGGGGGGGGGGEGESTNTNTGTPSATTAATKGTSSWLSRAHQHQRRKLPEQTELYAQLRRMGQAREREAQQSLLNGNLLAHQRTSFGDHDYCALSLGESHRRSAAMLGAILRSEKSGGTARGTESIKREAGKGGEEEEGEEDEGGRLRAASAAGRQQQQGEAVVDVMMTAMSVMSSSPERQSSAAATPPASEEEGEPSSSSRSPSPVLHSSPDSPASKTDSSGENSESCPEDKQRNKTKTGQQKDEDNCQVFYIHNLPSSVTQNMLRKRFQVFGSPEDCKVIIRNEERCGVIKIRQAGGQRHWRERDMQYQNGASALRRMTRKRYIDLDEAGPGPVKSKYDALDFDTLLKEAQKSLHR